MIYEIQFGVIIIDGKTYTSDLIIYPNGVIKDQWRRKNGHQLSPMDIESLIKARPEVIVAGMGASGLMKPDPELEPLLKKNNIDLIAEPNFKAIQSFNTLLESKKVGACFHLTC